MKMTDYISPIRCLPIVFMMVAPVVQGAQAEKQLDGAIEVAPATGELSQFRNDLEMRGSRGIRVTFPHVMVEIEKVKRGGQLSPIVFDPVVETRWLWLNQTEGVITFPYSFADPQTWSTEMRKVAHRAKLRPGLKDLAGHFVAQGDWGVQFAYDKFAIRGIQFLNVFDGDFGEDLLPKKPAGPSPAANDANGSDSNKEQELGSRSLDDPLVARPRVRLEFSRDVALRDVERLVYFEDNETHERFPVEVGVEERQTGDVQGWMMIEPVRSLPPRRSFLLVIDPLKEPSRHESLPHLTVVPAGTTYPLVVRRVVGLNQPLTGAAIRITGNQPIDPRPANLKLIGIVPSVENLHAIADGNNLDLRGDYNTGSEYRVAIQPGLKSTTALDLEQPSNWKAHFHQKRPAVVFSEPVVFRRASTSTTRCSFVQVNTGQLDWKVSRIPRDMIETVRAKLQEFAEVIRDEHYKPILSDTSEFQYTPTELLIPQFGFSVTASGTIDASGGDKEIPRTVEWKSEPGEPGVFLVEVDGKDDRGRVIGNHCILSRGDFVISEIESAPGVTVRVSAMRDGKPVPNLPVEITSEKGPGLSAITDHGGEALFDKSKLKGEKSIILVGTGDAVCFQDRGLPSFGSGSGWFRDSSAVRSVIFTDRNLYRPGETVMMKGFIRQVQDGKLTLPGPQDVGLEVSSHIFDSPGSVYQTKVHLSPAGSWEGEWQIPPTAFGNYYIEISGAETKITVGEFRPPSFSVATETEDVSGDVARAKVTSIHFHGAPNAGAKVRWRAEWLVDNWGRGSGDAESREGLILTDDHSPDAPNGGMSGQLLLGLSAAGWDAERPDREVSISAAVEGETTLDSGGSANLECKSPFPSDSSYGRAKVFWIVDVTSAAAETLRGGAVTKVQFVPKIFGAALESAGKNQLRLQIDSLDYKDSSSPGLAGKAEVFRVNVKSVKEKLGTNFNRYRNFPVFEKIWEHEFKTPFRQTIKAAGSGRYVVSVRALEQPHTPHVSDASKLPGWGEVGVENESSLVCKPVKPRYTVGERAQIEVETPFTGTATLTAETDRVLFRQTVQLHSNLQRLALPVLDSFAPNIRVCVHLIQAVPDDAIPAERFGSCEIQVERPQQRLEVLPRPRDVALQPGGEVSGVVKVACNGKAVAGAEVTLFAVDEAVLQLGRWKLPDLEGAFFPRRPWTVDLHSALGRLWNPEKPEELTHAQKGFILGDAGPRINQVMLRKDFRALAFWNGTLRTNGAGEAPFRFKAPDTLTTYRLVAVAQHGIDQFGSGNSEVRLFRKLQIEPALPDFVRQEDELTLRAVVRQDYADSDDISVTVAPDRAFRLAEPATKRVTAKKGIPVVVSFASKVSNEATRGTISFLARSIAHQSIHDAQENSLPVHPSSLEMHRAVAGELASAQPLNLPAILPHEWLSAHGSCDVILSGSPFLSKLAGLPMMLEAQGSVEKLSTRVLSATLLWDAMQYLPAPPETESELRGRAQDALKRLAQTLVEDRGVPIWPGGTEPNYFTTVQTAWAIRSARQRGFVIDDALVQGAETWLNRIISKQIGFDTVAPDLTCLALMVKALTATTPGAPSGQVEPFANPNQNGDQPEELFKDRAKLTDEGRAWLALAFHYLDILPDAQRTLLGELQGAGSVADFNPTNFSSATRAGVIRLLARSEIESTNWSDATRAEMRGRFAEIAKSSIDLSTQENFWLLLLFNSMMRGEISPAMADRPLTPHPSHVSRNRISVGWLNVPLATLPQAFPAPLSPGVDGSYLIRATYQQKITDPIGDSSLAVDRTVRNLTDSSRTGTADAPFQLGDQVLVTYRLNTDRVHNYLELEDQLPACFETANYKMPMIAQYFQLPIEAGVNTLSLSHVELRFARTLLYFEKAVPGRNAYSVLARISSAGVFHWPATQVRPMYDSRFTARSGATVICAGPSK